VNSKVQQNNIVLEANMSNKKMTGAALLVKALEKENIDTIFGIPGVHNLKIYDALAKSNIKHVTTRNESGAGFMADGYARISGKVDGNRNYGSWTY